MSGQSCQQVVKDKDEFLSLTKLWNILNLAMHFSHKATHSDADGGVNAGILKRLGSTSHP